MSLPLHPDGCIIANIPVKHFVVYFAPKCEHKKIRGAYVTIDAPSASDAMEYAATWIRLAGLTPQDVIEVPEVPGLIQIESASNLVV
jgi:hypothetical protein